MKKIFKPFLKLYSFSKKKVVKSIRLELVVTFGICLLAAFILGSWYTGYYNDKHMMAEVDYSSGIQRISSDMEDLKGMLDGKNSSDEINKMIDSGAKDDIKVYLTDTEGKVLFKSSNAKEKKIDIHDLIVKSEKFKREYDKATVINTVNGIIKKTISLESVEQYNEIDGIKIDNKNAYIIVSGIPKQKITYIRPGYSPFLSGIIAVITFVFIFYFLTNRKMEYIESVSNGLVEISKGNLDYRIMLMGEDELKNLADNINSMASELQKRIEKEREAEKTKNDLITNVSHDLRTPLTSVKGYLLLLKDKKYRDSNEFQDFIEIAYNKSEKLENLINDLFEYTKLSNRVIELNKVSICLDELLEQLVEELYVICKENNTEIEKEITEKNIFVKVDGDKMVRVFENLLMNAIRYSKKPGKIKLKVEDQKAYVIVTVENECEHINNQELKKIFNRFYRRDKSRSEATGGSGLGLAIAKSIVELHNGEIWAESREETISLFVKLFK
ncbi:MULTISPECIES: sensor histidine kinase [Clostridium]|uniref:histidine kinase n=1 Tax=Clostridium acetobutylicum (strain ATCC 824 / DSM 792 / JCM 1419 / IAM 19013 / LMG 5710 / NBRC 13948 / NRRL B-527 / VKM B-1787 / 2291 / W) TaxID=272562 RepID=Q97LJ5_CLOAB|nr:MULTISPECIES: ATP-binding protein [Clostridium]AAK78544.1 Histidine kinase (HAMP, HisKA and HATPase domains) [Clostridium acetobutylicum ATCC 824]AWV80267.1 GHKL domain-containing protein [Clostridium acetobutylicum]PSM06070.1 two-component sensor histidine kinase [Clostridium sp. NJ4]TQD49339.1 GHKL domain-containing protein [Clostridium acetobutylicum]